MQQQNMPALIERISSQIEHAFKQVNLGRTQLSGEGLLWFLTAESPELAQKIWADTLHNGTLTSCAGKAIRLMPAATIRDDYLQQGLMHLRYALEGNPRQQSARW